MITEKNSSVKQPPSASPDRPCGHCGEPHAYLRGFPLPWSNLQVCLRCHADLEREAFGEPLHACDECGEELPDSDLYPRGRYLLCSSCWDIDALARLALEMVRTARRLLDMAEGRRREGR